MSFAKTFRPVKASQLIGEPQKKIATALLEKVKKGDIAQELMFIGPSGVGKTTISYMYCRALLGLPPDAKLDNYIIEVNGSSDTGVDFVRTSIISSLNYAPMEGAYKIYYIDEVHGMSKAAQNALLKDTENLPPHVVMILSTTEPEKVIPTVRSRFTQYHLDPPNIIEFRKLAHFLGQTDDTFNMSDEVRDEIIALSAGNVREFCRMLDRVQEGSYVPFVEQAKDEGSLVHSIMYGRPIAEWFIAADKEQAPAGFSVGITHYAASFVRNPKTNQGDMKRALKVIKTFGKLDTYRKEELYQKLAILAEEIYGA